MNYELFEALKDVGFPLTECGNEDCHIPILGIYHIPTLSDLIEACGDQFDALFSGFDRIDEGYLHKNQWRADATDRTGFSCAGSTPEESVARLWIALNKK